MKILLAEDDATSRQILATQLVRLGHEVNDVVDGMQAWTAFQKEKPELLITDWIMPNLDGLDLCRRVRGAATPGYTYIIILTALDRKVGYLDGMNAGADDFVTKPCDIVELTVRLRVAERILALQNQMNRLEGLLPICPRCKRIHAGPEVWEAVEGYFMKRSDAQFSHGICPECFETQMKPQLEMIRKRRG
ncbi:MAG TPA: response regulator [Bacteroidota bacterium]